MHLQSTIFPFDHILATSRDHAHFDTHEHYQPLGSACSNKCCIVITVNQPIKKAMSKTPMGRIMRRIGTMNGSVKRARKRMIAYLSSIPNQEAIARTNIAMMSAAVP